MKLSSIRIITDDLDGMVDFYETVTGITADRPAPPFAELISPSGTLAIGHSQTVAMFGEGAARPAENHSVIIEWQVDDVDTEFARLNESVKDWAQTPTTMPWGNRSAMLRDPDGNLINLYAPITDEAKQRFAGR